MRQSGLFENEIGSGCWLQFSVQQTCQRRTVQATMSKSHLRLKCLQGDVCRTLDAGRWTLDAGRWTLDAGRWTLDAGRWTETLHDGLCCPILLRLEITLVISLKYDQVEP